MIYTNDCRIDRCDYFRALLEGIGRMDSNKVLFHKFHTSPRTVGHFSSVEERSVRERVVTRPSPVCGTFVFCHLLSFASCVEEGHGRRDQYLRGREGEDAERTSVCEDRAETKEVHRE